MMTTEQQRIAIAEWAGWKVLDTTTDINGKKVLWWSKTPSMGDAEANGIPDYCNDLNAIHEAEKLLTIPESVDYEEQLDCVVNREFTEGKSVIIFPIWHATASQRSEALCRTLWPERFESL